MEELEDLDMKASNENGTCTSESTSHKVLIDPTVPIENLLGSVTTFNNVEGSESFQLRTSARVFKKMKLDSALAALPEKKEPEKKEEAKEAKKPFQKPFWTTEDKNYFFEALNEYGKDFESIHTYINAKLKKKGASDTSLKSREQIRHLYYRTWHKISKHLKFSEDVKKVVQELYGLINYGELRKKLASVSEKTCIKLNELIYRGSVAIRVKGRTIRVKTPMCKALRKLNRLEETEDDIKLPTRVLVECMPKDMYTWMKVQELSQNPRVRALVPLQRRLSSLIYFLGQRWRSSDVLEHEKLLQVNESLSRDSDGELFNERIDTRNDPPLRLSPPKDCTIILPTFNITEFFTTQSICLNAYEERIGAKQSGEALWLAAFPSLKQIFKNSSNKRGIKRTRTESNSEKGSSPNNNPSCSNNLTDNNENCMTDSELNIGNVDAYVDQAVNTILLLQQQERLDPEPEQMLEDKGEINDDDCLILVKKEHDIANIRLGWTLKDCGALTVGDLYLMFGADSKISLEYTWDEVSPQDKIKAEPEKNGNSENLENVDVKVEKNETNNEIDAAFDDAMQTPSISRTNVTAALKQLLSVAKLHYRKNIVKCPCGHVCGSPSKTQMKSKVSNKPANIAPAENKVLDVQAASTMVTVIQQSNITTTANMVPIIIQPEIKKFSPQSLFRRPNSPNCGLRAQINSIQRMIPRYCNRKGRPRTKQVVVERKLPLLAKKMDNTAGQMTMVPQEIAISQPIAASSNVVTFDASYVNAEVFTNEQNGEENSVLHVNDSQQQKVTSQSNTIAPDLLDNATTLSRVSSPTSISNLLDMALQTHEQTNVDGPKDAGITSFVGLLAENPEHEMESTPPASPSRLLKENDNQWINAEVGDFSFSSFLGHLDSPMKAPSTTVPPALDDTRMSLTHDMDAQLQSLLTESSMDYTAKFADLAAQVTDSKK